MNELRWSSVLAVFEEKVRSHVPAEELKPVIEHIKSLYDPVSQKIASPDNPYVNLCYILESKVRHYSGLQLFSSVKILFRPSHQCSVACFLGRSSAPVPAS